MKEGSLLAYLRLRPFGTATAEGRDKERRRRLALSASASLAAKLLSAAVSIVTVPLTVGYLGTERYGLWLTVGSLVAMLAFADLGIGNGLMTKVAEASGRKDAGEVQRLVSSGFYVLAGVAALLAFATCLMVPFVDCASALGVTGEDARREVRALVIAVSLNFYVAMPFAVVQRVQGGLQEGYASTLWTMAGTILGLSGLVVATTVKAGLVPLVLALVGAPTMTLLANFAWYFWRDNPEAAPRLKAFDWVCACDLLKTGGVFVVLQVAAACAFLSDNVVVARMLGPAVVPTLAMPAKLFALMAMPIGMVVGPLWPAYGEAKARGDSAWIVRTLRWSTLASVVAAMLGGMVLLILGRPLVTLWTRGAVNVGDGVLLPLALWGCLSAWGQAVASFLNGVGKIRLQAVSATCMAAAVLVLKWLWVGPFGVAGVAWGTTVGYLLFTVIPLGIVVRAAQRELMAEAGACGDGT